MPAFTLYGSRGSTNTDRVRLTLAEGGFTDYELVLLNLQKGEQKSQDNLSRHPFGKIPVIVFPSGFTLYESRAVCKYLARKYSFPLLPSDSAVEAAALLDQAQSVEMHYFAEPAGRIAFEKFAKRFMGLPPDDAVVSQALQVVETFFDVAERLLKEREYMAGGEFTVVDIFYIPLIQRLFACGYGDVVRSRENQNNTPDLSFPDKMDGLRDLATSSFQLYNKFRDPIPKTEDESKIQVFRISSSANENPEISNTFVPEDSLPTPTRYDDPTPGKHPRATLQMTIITRGHDEVIGMSKPNFLRLFDSYNLDPFTLNYISQNFYGFHSSLTPHNGAYSVLIGTVPFTIVFSFNPTTLATSAILLARVYNGLTSGKQVVQEFTRILQQYAERVDTPAILALVALVHLGQWQDGVLYKSLQMIRSAEDVSGYGPSGRASERVDIDDLLGVQWRIGEIVLGLANVDRHHDIAQSLFGYLESQVMRGGGDQVVGSNEGLADVVNVLRQQFSGANSTAKYLRERTECHSAVVSSSESVKGETG
ncbi:hypothetical protein OQA88_7898 [Cercophora sp. LCS_1]